jgi:transcription elongation GreA/GreB family factor
VAFGAEVSVRDPEGKERVVVVASADEIGLVPHAASATSPMARALMGAHPGDVVEFSGPRGPEELTVVDVRFPP